MPEGFRLVFSPGAADVLKDLESSPQYGRKLKKVRKTLGLIQRDPRHPGLNSHTSTCRSTGQR